MPDDEAEQTRLAVAHQAYLPALNDQLTVGLIPRSAKRILDIGTGTGDWAYVFSESIFPLWNLIMCPETYLKSIHSPDVFQGPLYLLKQARLTLKSQSRMAIAERFPKAEIIATDITNAFQPPSAPPNVFFELDDAQNEWAYNQPFEFIHMRNLSGAFPSWDAIYSEVSQNLRLGGTFEIADRDLIQFRKDILNSNTSIFNGAIQSAADKSGRPLNLDHLKEPVFDKAGLRVVKTRVLEVPLGTYDPDPRKKLTGKMAIIAALEGLEAVSLRLLTKHLGWKEDDVRELCKKVKEEVMRPDAQAFIRVHFVIARKLI